MNPSKCPVCGWEVRLPVKRWALKSGRNATLTVAIYECLNPTCSYLMKAGRRMRWREIKSTRG